MNFAYARYNNYFQEKTGFGMADCSSLPGLKWKYFNSVREENHEPIFIYIDKYMHGLYDRAKKVGVFAVTSNTIILNLVIIT